MGQEHRGMLAAGIRGQGVRDQQCGGFASWRALARTVASWRVGGRVETEGDGAEK